MHGLSLLSLYAVLMPYCTIEKNRKISKRIAKGYMPPVNTAIAVARVFQKPTRGDLSLLGFELMALGYFLPVKTVIEFDQEVVRLSAEQKTILVEMSKVGLIDQPDENHPLVAEYVRIINEAEALIQRIHAAYRQHVSLRGVYGKQP